MLAALGIGGFFLLQAGLSARTAPVGAEAWIAGKMRALAVPSRYRGMRNPVECTPDVLSQAEEHWADHCATCHANNGSGDSLLGRTMYPRPPHMTAPGTQSQTDGELYNTIQNGVRLTGMPAFGQPGDDDKDSWKLVCLIRHLPAITGEELDRMKAMNPKTPGDLEEEKQERDFLGGGASPQPEGQHHHH